MAVASPPAPVLASKPNRPGTRPAFLAVALAAISLAVFLLNHFWPFERQRMIQNLQEATDSQVQLRAFRRIYFPSPGCILEGVVFVHGAASSRPLITIEKLTIKSTYPTLVAHHLSRINAEGVRIFVPPIGEGQPFHIVRSDTTIGEIVANGATLEFALHDPRKPPLRFDIHEASLSDVSWTGALNYRVKVRNPDPPGEVTAKGKFGGWNQSDPALTPISGEYKFERADLSVYGGIAGLLSSTGKFGGNLGHIDISGSTDTPDFSVQSGGTPVHLSADFTAYVDATRGDTFLKRVDARFRKTHVVAAGSIAGAANGQESNGKGKIALLDLDAHQARIEDILALFLKQGRSPMSGAVTLRAKVQIPSGDAHFLEKIRLQGNFGVGGAEFTSLSTQNDVDKLSAGARGEKESDDPETVLTDLTGQASIDHGVAQFADLSFGVPGASARMHGTYNLINHKIDLHGQMHVRTKISNTTSGAKSLLLKAMDPFFKKRKRGEVLPVRISGTYANPSFGLDLDDKKAQVAPPHKPKPPR